MNEFNRTPQAPRQPDSPQPPPEVGGALAALNDDGHDCRVWWQLDTVEQASRMDKHDRAWWTRHRLVTAAEALRVGIIEATRGLK